MNDRHNPNYMVAGTELWNSEAIGQCNKAPTVSIEFPLSGAEGPA